MFKDGKKVSKFIEGKVVGVQEFINRDTGEIVEMLVVDKNVLRDRLFHKVWLFELTEVLELIGSKKLVVLSYIIENIDSENKVLLTIDKIVKEAKVSRQTAHDVIKILLKANFLSRIQVGAYRINPEIIAWGNSNRRKNLLIKYEEERVANNINIDEKLNNVA